MKKLAIATVLLSLLAVPAHALSTRDLLATIAMPLAVAAVADVAGVEDNQLADLVATLNQADVPPTQFVEVIRYVPVALVNTNGQPVFVDYVQTQVSQGITGNALVDAIVQQLRTQYDVTPQITVYEPSQTFVPQPVQVQPVFVPRTVVENTYIPQAVQTRVTEVRVHPVHPHGGPPGQLKKIYGVKTGAEIVHGPKKHFPPPMISSVPQPQVVQPQVIERHGPPGGVPPGQAKKEGGGEGHGKGKGKGHGKD